MKVFYSWQSWIAPNTNRHFIEKAIKAAIDSIHAEEILEYEELEFDRDTLGMTGSIDIARTIFDKIKEAQVFICDITPVCHIEYDEETMLGTQKRLRAIPNPNVLIELGYATQCIGWENIICVFNDTYGSVNDLPFDLRQHRILRYLYGSKKDKSNASEQLTNQLFEAIKIIVDRIQNTSAKLSVLDQVKQLANDGNQQAVLEDLIHKQTEQIYSTINSSEFYSIRNKILQGSNAQKSDIWTELIDLYTAVCRPALETFIFLCRNGNEKHTEFVVEALKRWITLSQDDPIPGNIVRYIPGWLLIYTVGIAAISRQNGEQWGYLSAVFGNPSIYDRNRRVFLTPLIAITENLLSYYELEQLQIQEKLRRKLSDFIQVSIRELYKPYISNDEDHYNLFDIFESILTNVVYQQSLLQLKHGFVLPVLRECVNPIDPNSSYYRIKHFWENGGKLGALWGLLNIGLFDDKPKILSETLEQRSQYNYAHPPCVPINIFTFYETGRTNT